MARKSLAAPIASGPFSSKTEQDYRAEDDHRTLMRASEVQQDASRMKAVARHHAKMTKDLSRVGAALHEKAESPRHEATEEMRTKKPAPRRMARRSR